MNASMKTRTPAWSSDLRACVTALTTAAALTLGAAAIDPSIAWASQGAPPTASPLAAANAEPPSGVSVEGVVLADESGSITQAGVDAERDAAAALVESDPSPGSRFMIAGFGSQNAPGQRAVVPYCNFITTASPSARASLANCARQISPRTKAEGWDTDQAAAIQFALEQLAHRPGLVPVIFLLTDGRLDVHNSPSYGRVTTDRTPEALRRLTQEILPLAKTREVQVWPLGFGPLATYASLEPFAVGGGGPSGRCVSAETIPHAIIVRNIGQVVRNLVAAEAAVRCGAVGSPVTGIIREGSALDLHVAIAPIATDGALTVVTDNPLLQVRFLAPDGRAVPDNGAVGNEVFDLSGGGERVQTLRITNPEPGTWDVRVSDPTGTAAGEPIVAFASWSGVLSSSLFLTPLQPVPGEDLEIEVHVLSRSGVITGRALDGVRVQARITDSAGSFEIPLHLQGAAFRGRVTVADDARGTILVTDQVNGPGIAGDTRSATVTLQRTNFLSATFVLPVPATIHPGFHALGTVLTTNEGPPAVGMLRLGGLSPGALVSVRWVPLQIPTGRATFPFTINVSRGTRLGPAYGSIYLVSPTGPTDGYSFDASVTPTPGYWPRHMDAFLALGSVLVIVAALLIVWLRGRSARSRRLADTRGLGAALLRDGRQDGDVLEADGGPVFELALLEDGHQRLMHADVAAGRGTPIGLRRTGTGVLAQVANQPPQTVPLGDPVQLGPDLALVVLDRAATTPVAPATGSPAFTESQESGDADRYAGRWR
jgi:VWA domain-containing protein